MLFKLESKNTQFKMRFKKKYLSVNKDLLSILLIVVLCLLFCRNFLSFNRDILAGSFPPDGVDLFIAHSLSADALINHYLPFWNPYVLGGLPALAEPHNAIFYPMNLIFLILPTNIAFNYSIVLHLILAGIFMYYLSRTIQMGSFASLFTTITFIFSSIFTLRIFVGQLNTIHTIAWIPLLFLLVEKSTKTKKMCFTIIAGIVLSMQIFSGHLQYVVYTILAIVFYLLFKFINHPNDRQIIIKTGAYLIAIGILLSAIQLLPTLEFTTLSSRAANSYAFLSSFSLAPENLITMLIPEFFGNALNESYEFWGRWFFQEECLYMGILPLILALLALKLYWRDKNEYVTFFGWFSIISLIIASAYCIPILKNILRYIPVLTLFRAQGRFKLFIVFSLSILSGFAIDGIFRNRQKIKLEKKVIFHLYILILLLAAIVFTIKLRFDFWSVLWVKFLSLILSNPERFWIYDYRDADFIIKTFLIAYAGFKKFILFLCVSLTLLIILNNKRIRPSIIKFLFLSFIIVDLWSFSMKYVKALKLSDFLWSKEAVKFLKNDHTFYRIVSFDKIPNITSFYKKGCLGGSTALQLRDYGDFVNASQIFRRTKDYIMYFYPSTKPMDVAGFKYLILSQKDELDFDANSLVFSDDRIRIFKNPNALERAFMVFKAKLLSDRQGIINEFKSKDFDPKEYVILETTDENRITEKPKNKSYNIEITEYSPNETILNVDTYSDGYLFLSDVYYPAWKVYVDGKIDKIYKANIAFRAIFLKKGRHRVKFIYDSFYFKLGSIISLATLLFLIILLSIKSKIKIKT